MTKEELKQEAIKYAVDYPASYGKGYKHKDLRIAYLAGAEPREKRIAELERKLKVETELSNRLGLAYREYEQLTKEQDEHLAELEAQIEKMKWHKLDWDKAEESPDVDKLVRVRTRSGAEYICETYSYFPTEDEIGYGSVITQFSELNGNWVDDNEIEYWCYIEPFREIKEK